MPDIFYSYLLAGIFSSSLAVYSVRMWKHGRARNQRVDAYGESLFVSTRFLEFGAWVLSPLVSLLAFLGVTPNQVTLFALLPALAAGVATAYGHFGLAALLSAIAALSDAMDGMLARRTGRASEAGKVLDSTVDRYMEFFLIGGLLFYFRASAVLCVLGLATLVGAFMISYSTAKAEAMGVTAPRGSMRRAERAIYLVAGSMLTPISHALSSPTTSILLREGPILFALGIVAVVANVSAIRRIAAITKAVQIREFPKLVVPEPEPHQALAPLRERVG